MIYTITLNPSIDRTLCYPKVALGHVNRATSVRTDLSGKGVNVSVALAGIGVESVLMGFRAGVSGDVLIEGLRARGFACDFVPLESGETRSNITVLDEATGVTTKLNEPGPHVCARDLEALADRLEQRLAPGDICVLSGSLPPGAPLDSYARLIRIAHQKGALAALDTSGAALRAGCEAAPDWLKPNDVEAASLIDKPVEALSAPRDLADAIEAMLSLGPQRILLTLGPRGALYADGQASSPSSVELWWARPPEIDEVSNVGAGDASLAGALYAWAQGYSPRDVARWAVASGTAAAQEDGSSMATKERITAVYENVSFISV